MKSNKTYTSLILSNILFAIGSISISHAQNQNIISGVSDPASTSYNTTQNNNASVTIKNGDLTTQSNFIDFSPTSSNFNVNVGYADKADKTDANQNKLVVEDNVDYTKSYIKPVAYYIGRIHGNGKGDANNNYAEFNKGSFRGVYVGQTQNGGGHKL